MFSANPDLLKIWLRNLRAWFYRCLPPCLPAGQLKRRAGYERRWGLETTGFTQEGFVRIFRQHLLAGIPLGLWVELQAGDGLVGSLGVWLERVEGWRVEAWEHREWPARSFRKNRPSVPLYQKRLTNWASGETMVPLRPVGITARGSREAAAVCRAIRQGRIRPSILGFWNPSRRRVWEARLRRCGYRLQLIHDRTEFYLRVKK